MEQEQKTLKIAYGMEKFMICGGVIVLLRILLWFIGWVQGEYADPNFNVWHFFPLMLGFLLVLMFLGYLGTIFFCYRLGKKNFEKGNFKEASSYGETSMLICLVPDVMICLVALAGSRGGTDFNMLKVIAWMVICVYKVICYLLFLKCTRVFKRIEKQERAIECENPLL